jgi:hypothetical protein
LAKALQQWARTQNQCTQEVFMRRKIPLSGMLMFAVTLLLVPFTSTMRSQSQSQQPNEQQQSAQRKVYLGQIVKAKDGRFALLVDKQAGTGFFLDDQEKAKRFEGQNVKVIGTLDAANYTIRVSDIQPA